MAVQPAVGAVASAHTCRKTLLPAPPEDESCSCNECPFMRRNTLEKLYLCLRDLAPQVDVPEPIRVRALAPIQRMLEMSA